MGQEITVRHIGEDESAVVASLAVDAFAEYAARMSPDAWSAFAREIASVGSGPSDDEILVAQRDGDVVGTLVLYTHWEGAQIDACNVRMIAVAPAHRGEGIAKALLTDAIDRCRRAGKARVVMAINAEMGPGRSLCERLGFERYSAMDHMPAPGVHVQGYQLLL